MTTFARSTMRKFVASLLILVALGVQAQSSDEILLFSSTDLTGVSVKYVISKKRAETVPVWDPLSMEPPLTLARASGIALDWLKTKHPDVPTFLLSGISIREFPIRPALAKRWYYQLDFDPVVGGKRLGGGQFAAIIPFDGSVVEPQPTLPRRP